MAPRTGISAISGKPSIFCNLNETNNETKRTITSPICPQRPDRPTVNLMSGRLPRRFLDGWASGQRTVAFQRINPRSTMGRCFADKPRCHEACVRSGATGRETPLPALLRHTNHRCGTQQEKTICPANAWNPNKRYQ